MRIRNLFVLSLVVMAMVGAACSSSSPSPTSSAAATSSPSADALCTQEQAVKDSFNALAGTDIVSEGTDALKSRFDTFTADLAALKTTASSEFSSQVDAVQTSVDQLKTVVDDADTAGVAATAAGFAAGLGSLKTSTQALFTAIDQACAG
jgi:hypothetical protein